MSITNIERMVDALVRDEVLYAGTLNRGDMVNMIEELVREKYEAMPERHIIEDYERLA
jgi:hypothetical protein